MTDFCTHSNRILSIPALFLYSLIAACSHLTDSNTTPTDTVKLDVKTPDAKSISSTSQTIELSAETLNDLMLAEMASKENRLDITLGNYIKQARATQDPNVIARATRIAQYLNAHQASLEMATLWAKVEPNNLEALQLLTLQMIRRQRFEEAVVYMDRLLALKANTSFDFLVAQTSQLNTQERQPVINSLDKLLNKYPQHSQLWFTKALLCEQSKQHEEALSNVNQSLMLDPSAIAPNVFKATLLVDQKDTRSALKLLKKTVNQHPDNKNLRILYARLLIQDNQLKAAQKQFTQLVELFPEDSDLKLTLALLCWENKLSQPAQDYLNELLSSEQKVNEAHFELGQIAVAENRLAQAIQHYQAVGPSAQYLPAKLAIAQIYAEQNNIPQARQTLAMARQENLPQSIPLYIFEAELLSKYQQPQLAYSVFSEAFSHYPNDISLLYSRAMLFEAQKNYLQMEVDLRAILKQEPNNVMALNALGYSFADRGEQLDEALALIQKAVTLKPDDAAILDSLGWVYYKKNQLSLALQYLQKAYQQVADHEIAAHLGEVLWVSDHKQQAQHIWQQGLKTNPDSELINSTMQRLQN